MNTPQSYTLIRLTMTRTAFFHIDFEVLI